MKCLVIVDMQPRFESALCNETAENIIQDISYFKEQNQPIVILEYRDCSKTREDILAAIGDYHLVTTQIKHRDDGSTQVLEGLNKLGYHHDMIEEFYLTGVNFGACVKKTAVGLTDFIPPSVICIKEKSCNQPERWNVYNDEYSFDNVREFLIQEGFQIV